MIRVSPLKVENTVRGGGQWRILFSLLFLAAGTVPAAGQNAEIRPATPAFFVAGASNHPAGWPGDGAPVVASLRTSRGSVLFSPDGAFIGIPASRERTLTPAGGRGTGAREGDDYFPAARAARENTGNPLMVVLSSGFSARRNKAGGSTPVRLAGETGGRINILTGNPDEWRTGLPAYRELIYEDVWPNVDVTFEARGAGLVQRLDIPPGTDLAELILETGADELITGPDGGLTARLEGAELRLAAPRAFTGPAGSRTAIPAGYRILPDGRYGLRMQTAGLQSALTVEIPLSWNTLVGGEGTGDDVSAGVATDSAGFVYIAGGTSSGNFPTSAGVYDTTHNGGKDIFVTKLSPGGSSLIYSTLIGGATDDAATALALDGSGHVYITGETSSTNFPATAGALDTTYNGILDTFVIKLNPAGSSLIYSTILGGAGEDFTKCIQLDGAGNAYLAGFTSSTDFPVTAGAYDTTPNGQYDVYAAKLNATGTALIYSTFIGGTDFDRAYGLGLDGSLNAYVAGYTYSADYPATAGAFDTTHNGKKDAILSKLNSTGTELIFSTFLGGNEGEQALCCTVDGSGNAYVAGLTPSANFPVTAGAFDTTYGGAGFLHKWGDAYVTKFNSTGSALLYSTYLGGSGDDVALGIDLDSQGNACVTGTTFSSQFPATAGAYDTSYNGGGWLGGDIFVSRLNGTGTALDYSTFLGGKSDDGAIGIWVDPADNIYVTGGTMSIDFPTTPGAYDRYYGQGYDLFVARFGAATPLHDPVVQNLRIVPAGAFNQGSPDGEAGRGPDETVFGHTIGHRLAVMATEVTRQMWADLKAVQTTLPDDPSSTTFSPGMNHPVQRVTWPMAVLFANLLSQQQGLTRCYYKDAACLTPVTAANYSTGTIYCSWTANGYRLPAEGEWEYACRAGATTPFTCNEPAYSATTATSCTAGELAALESFAIFCANSSNIAVAAGSKSANGWDLHEMHGNVMEWCWDWYGNYPAGPAADYTGPASGTSRVIRGGAFDSQPKLCRSAARAAAGFDWLSGAVGFRLVRNLDAPAARNFTVGGLVGVGRQNPERALQLVGNNAVFRMDRTMDASAFLMVRTDGTGGLLKGFLAGTESVGANLGQFVFKDTGTSVDDGTGTSRLTIENDGTATFTGDVKAKSLITTSTARQKEGIVPLTGAAERLGLLQGVRFYWKAEARPAETPAPAEPDSAAANEDRNPPANAAAPRPAEIGLIAEAVASVIPEAVRTGAAGGPGVDYHKLLAVVLETMKTQQAKLDEIARLRDTLRLQLCNPPEKK